MDTYPNQYIPKLILDYMSDELADSDFYKKLASTVKEKDVEEILRNIRIDEEKHYKICRADSIGGCCILAKTSSDYRAGTNFSCYLIKLLEADNRIA